MQIYDQKDSKCLRDVTWCKYRVGATARYYTSHTKTMLPTRMSVQAIGPHEGLLMSLKRRKLQWYDHVSRSSGLAKSSCKAKWKGEEDKADRGRGGRTSGNGQAWSSASPRGQWRTGAKEKTACKIICGAPTTLAVKGLMMMMMMMKYRVVCNLLVWTRSKFRIWIYYQGICLKQTALV